MFDYNIAPFFQSLVVVTVDPVGRRVIIRPWGIHGPLTWREFDRSVHVKPTGVSLDQLAAWVMQ
jgi:hypothetical protein